MAEESQTVVTNDEPVTMGQLLQLIQQLNTSKPTPEPTINVQNPIITEKLTNENYTRWSRLMQLAINGRGKLKHIIADPPAKTDPEYSQWTRYDSVVISWILENIDTNLVNQFLDYPTARSLWLGIETLYSSGRDGLQIFDLTVKTNKIQQGTDSLEIYYGKLLALWQEIDRRQPNPMKDPEDIIIYNQIIHHNRLYQFLAGLDESYDKDRRDLLIQSPLPTVEEAYAGIRREMLRRGIMKRVPSSESDSSGIGGGYTVKSKTYRKNDEKSHLRCSHCGGTRHTKSECFKLIGYPEWWPDSKKKNPQKFSDNRAGKAAVSMSNNGEQEHEGVEGEGKALTAGCSDRTNDWAWY
ncbi:unnamed protein product [Amaranthus hypochondriacus]